MGSKKLVSKSTCPHLVLHMHHSNSRYLPAVFLGNKSACQLEAVHLVIEDQFKMPAYCQLPNFCCQFWGKNPPSTIVFFLFKITQIHKPKDYSSSEWKWRKCSSTVIASFLLSQCLYLQQTQTFYSLVFLVFQVKYPLTEITDLWKQ